MDKSKKPTRKKSLPEPSSSDVKLPKLPKMKKPDNSKIRTKPLFSLPEEVLKLPPPPKAARKEMAPVIRKKSVGNKECLSYVFKKL